MTFSSAVRFGSSWNDWNTSPHDWRAQPCAAVLVQGEQILAGQPHAARAGNIQPGQQSQQGGLARARAARDRHGAARLDRKIDSFQDRQRAAGVGDPLAQPFHLDRVIAIHAPIFPSAVHVRPDRRRHRARPRSDCPSAQGSAPRAVLVLGDSLSAEYGIKRGTGWAAAVRADFATIPQVQGSQRQHQRRHHQRRRRPPAGAAAPARAGRGGAGAGLERRCAACP